MSDLEIDYLFKLNIAFQLIWMTIMYFLYVLKKNGSFVDFGWPSGFFIMAFAHLVYCRGYWLRKTLICAMYLIAGARFMFGWVKRGHLVKEDARWILWRELWAEGKGMFGIKNEYINGFAFYHAQSLANVFFFIMPLQIACSSEVPGIGYSEIFGVILWFFAFWLENKADFQRLRFIIEQKKQNKPSGGVLNKGLWKYSRHPNYFCELLVWIAYVIYTLPYIQWDWRTWLLFCVPLAGYYFLVEFTGIYITERSMMRKRKGTPFEKEFNNYLRETSKFFPWFPNKTGGKLE